jgi:hypothetical protein
MDGRTTFLSEFGVKALHFEHQSFHSCVLPPSVRTATIERIYCSCMDRWREHARTDGRTTFLFKFGVEALHFAHRSLDTHGTVHCWEAGVLTSVFYEIFLQLKVARRV